MSIENSWFGSVSQARSNCLRLSFGFSTTQGENEATSILLRVKSNSYSRIRPLPP